MRNETDEKIKKKKKRRRIVEVGVFGEKCRKTKYKGMSGEKGGRAGRIQERG